MSPLPIDWQNFIAVWSAASLVTLAGMQFGKPFITPEIKAQIKCHFCDPPMETSELICQSCKRKSDGK
jgi:hypothetical protein